MESIDEKKGNNICEYIVHMYQTEDLLRVYNFDIKSIEEFVISHLPVGDKEKEEFKNWYLTVMEEMEAEDITINGHLSRVQAHVNELTELHEKLLNKDQEYEKIYHEAAPHINNHLALSEGKISNPIQICLNGVYGLLLLRLNGKSIEDNIMERINSFGNVLSYLAVKYQLPE